MINLIRALIAITRPVSQRLSPCELNGMVIGVVVGTFVSVLWRMGPASVPLSYPLWFYIALILALFCWVSLMIALCGFLKFEFGPLAAPVFVNAMLTSIFTVYLCNVSAAPTVFFLIGLFTGYVIGRLLCRSCDKFTRIAREG